MRCDFINYDKNFNIISINYMYVYYVYSIHYVIIMCISMKGQYIPLFQSCCVCQRNLMNFAVTKTGLPANIFFDYPSVDNVDTKQLSYSVDIAVYFFELACYLRFLYSKCW